jgi:hypothetical protein
MLASRLVDEKTMPDPVFLHIQYMLEEMLGAKVPKKLYC